jgi:SAM-dependent methyltransferase
MRLTSGVARERRLSFGSVAELYDGARPSYPDALVDDVLAVARLEGGQRALEVGAGTGKATVQFARRGVGLLALEPDPKMAAVAMRRCAPYPRVEVAQVEFERWPRAERFGLLVSGQAWHWVAPDVRYSRAHEALAEGGLLAVFWNYPDWDRSELRAELEAAYRGAAFPAPAPMDPASRPHLWGDWEREMGEMPGFAHPDVRLYDWSCDYTTEHYLRLLRTHSDHILLPEDQRAALLAAVASAIDHHGGTLRIAYVTRLCLARAC